MNLAKLYPRNMKKKKKVMKDGLSPQREQRFHGNTTEEFSFKYFD